MQHAPCLRDLTSLGLAQHRTSLSEGGQPWVTIQASVSEAGFRVWFLSLSSLLQTEICFLFSEAETPGATPWGCTIPKGRDAHP